MYLTGKSIKQLEFHEQLPTSIYNLKSLWAVLHLLSLRFYRCMYLIMMCGFDFMKLIIRLWVIKSRNPFWKIKTILIFIHNHVYVVVQCIDYLGVVNSSKQQRILISLSCKGRERKERIFQQTL